MVLDKDASHAQRLIAYNIGSRPDSKINLIQLAKSDGFNTSWPEYKVKKLANSIRSGKKSWRNETKATESDDYDPMGSNNNMYKVAENAE